MSLQVWLPLTRDLRNQGLSETTVTNSGATYSSTGGKLGGCYVFDGVDDSLAVGNLSTMVDMEFSFACWFYKDEWGSKGYETIFGGPSGFELESKVGATNSPVLKLYNWGGGSCTYELSKWNHIVFTRDTTETKLYLNGELKVTGTAGTIPNNNYFVGSWNTATQQNFKGKMCDVRIYDHCLSPMEVKQLNQGLILHYPLNDKYCESVTNLASAATGGWNNSGNCTRLFNDTSLDSSKPTSGPVISVKITTAGNCALTCGTTGAGHPSKTLTFSIWCYLSGPQENNSIYIRSTKTDGNVGNLEYNGSALPTTWPTDKWIRLEKTITTASDATTFYFCTYVNILNRYIALNGWQIEEKSHTNPWTPPGTTRAASVVEHDCSGFCNNGTRNSTFTWTSDTPRYKVSTTFGGSNYVLASSPTTEGKTIAAWVKTNAIANRAYFVDYKSGIGFGTWSNYIIVSCNSGIKTTFPTANFTTNSWNHIVVVKRSSSTLELYINGVAQTAGSTTDYWTTGVVDGLSLAARPSGVSPIPCQLSDFRIYATALSEKDIKSLYNNNAYIDENNKIYGEIR